MIYLLKYKVIIFTVFFVVNISYFSLLFQQKETKMNVFLQNCAFVIYSCAFLVSFSSGKVITSNSNDVVENDVGVSPLLSYCSGNFMKGAYNLKCMVNTAGIKYTWTKDGTALSNNQTKYEVSKGGDDPYRFLLLRIIDINNNDVGRYELSVSNSQGATQETIWITPVEACEPPMGCFENPCEWPMKMTCNSKPAAMCVTDMCNPEPEHWCMPKWFEGTEEVHCEDQEDYYNKNDY